MQVRRPWSTTTFHSRICGAALLAFAFAAHADDTGHAPAPQVRFTGPLVSSSPPVPESHFNIEPYLINTHTVGTYDERGHRQSARNVPDAWTLAVPMQYGASDRLGLGATFTGYLARTDSSGRQLAVGDTAVSLAYLLARGTGPHSPTLTLALKQNFTTGRHDRLDTLGVAQATGSGAPTTQLGLYGQAYFLRGGTLRGRFNATWQPAGAHASLEGESAYGTPPGFRGRAELGAAASGTLAVEYSLNPRWALASELIYERERSTRVRGPHRDRIRRPGGRRPGTSVLVARFAGARGGIPLV